MDQAKKVDADKNPLMPCLLLGDPCVNCKAKGEYVFITFSVPLVALLCVTFSGTHQS